MPSSDELEERARQLAPTLLLDTSEPFRPVRVGIEAGEGRHGELELEYTVVWEADIGHLVESERLWVSVDRRGQVHASASAHGSRVALQSSGGAIKALVAEPGKHAMNLDSGHFSLPRDLIEWMCGNAAGCHGLLAWGVSGATAAEDRGASRLLRSRAFTPSWEFGRAVDLSHLEWDSSSSLGVWMGERARSLALAQDTSPVGWTAQGWSGDGDLVLIRGCRWDGSAWNSVDGDLEQQMLRARRERRRLLLDLSGGVEHLESLWDLAWSSYVSSMVVIMASGETADTSARLGFTTARRIDAEDEPHPAGWVVAGSPDLVDLWAPHCLVIGPGEADIVCDV